MEDIVYTYVHTNKAHCTRIIIHVQCILHTTARYIHYAQKCNTHIAHCTYNTYVARTRYTLHAYTTHTSHSLHAHTMHTHIACVMWECVVCNVFVVCARCVLSVCTYVFGIT